VLTFCDENTMRQNAKTPDLIERNCNSSACENCIRQFPLVVIGRLEASGGIRPNRVPPHN
jgi:hypothetical protein